MNNNKKYKKWSLGLVAPALVLAPIAVVASCSSSSEEKEAYGVTFTNNNEIRATIHKAVQPNALTKDQFKEEVLAHKSDLFTIEGTLPSDNFLNDNIEISGLNASDDDKTVSANVKLNKANTSGESIEKTITLTGLGYEEVTLTDLEYSIQFNEIEQEIQLSDQEEVLVSTITAEKLIDLVLMADNKTKILDITGKDEAKITDEVLANQILSIDGDLDKDINNGKIKFTLKVSNPVNGTGEPLTKEITFTGFKSETDSTPPAETNKFKIRFKDETEALEGVSDRSVSDFPTDKEIKPIVIQNKDKIFETEKGDLPEDEKWWEEKLTISNPALDIANGLITTNISLDGFDTTETANDSTTTITKENVVLKGFREEAQTEAKTGEISTVTLGLNGTVAEVDTSNEINNEWVINNKRLLFIKGFNLIKEASDIKEVTFADAGSNKATLTFKVEANKGFSADGKLGTSEKSFTFTIKGFSGSDTKGQLLKHKSAADAPLSIGLVDPILAEGTFDEFMEKSSDIFNQDFVFKYRKHLLTGDFTEVDAAGKDGFLQKYPADSGSSERFVIIVPDQSKKTIQIKFTILKDKLVGTPAPATDQEYTITFKDFKAN